MEDENQNGIADHLEKHNKLEDPWFNWKSMTGYVYLLICLTDFVIMPAIITFSQDQTKQFIKEIILSENKEFALQLIDRVKSQQWEPTTLSNGGMFHLAFGALLTGAAVTKGFERKEALKQSGT